MVEYANFLYQIKKYQRSSELIENIKGDENLKFDYYLIKGRAYMGMEQYQEAINNLIEGNKIYNSDTGLLNALGFSYYKNGEKERALELLAEGKPPEQIQEELREGIKRSSYFRNSLIFGMGDGYLSLSKEGRFGEEMLKRLQPEIQRFIAQEPEYDRSVILASTLQYPTTKLMLYKPEFADFLSDSIEAILG